MASACLLWPHLAYLLARRSRHPDRAEIRIEGGPLIRAKLVIGAEGRESPLRAQAGIGVTRWDYGQVGMVGAFAHERPHHGTALEMFLPNGPFAQLPLAAPGGFGPADLPHASAYVWSERTTLARRFLAMDDTAFGRELQRRLGDHLGTIRPIGRRWSYPLSALWAERFTAERLALVGDAAHGIHPIAGQGLNLGFRDVAALAEALVESARQLETSRAQRKIVVLLSDCRSTSTISAEEVARGLDELVVISHVDDADEARAFATRVGARYATVSGPSDIPTALFEVLG